MTINLCLVLGSRYPNSNIWIIVGQQATPVESLRSRAAHVRAAWPVTAYFPSPSSLIAGTRIRFGRYGVDVMDICKLANQKALCDAKKGRQWSNSVTSAGSCWKERQQQRHSP
ncbi:hypothetical protein IF2G_09892 [Cordyceps javanica]|nr:hypothetical protein IF2G_09892 [Cordyceps javanica]